MAVEAGASPTRAAFAPREVDNAPSEAVDYTEETRAPPSRLVDSMTRKRVLVVDGEPEVRENLCELLSGWGYDVDAAEDGWDAVEVVVERPPDIIVTELPLPDGGASELIRFAKARVDTDMLVIAYSGWNHLEARARDAGADTFIAKPDLDRLQRALLAPPSTKRRPASRKA